MKKTTVAFLSGLLLSLMLSPTCLADTTIAEWKFETDSYNMLLDNSGNGNDLADFSITPVQYSSTEYAPGIGSTGSVYFDGTNSLTTFEELDMSSYTNQNLRVSYWIKNETPSDNEFAVIYETTSHFYLNAGGIMGGINHGTSDVSGIGCTGISWGATLGAPSTGLTYEAVDVNDFVASGTSLWEHYVVEYRPAANAANLVTIYKNGVVQPDTDPAPWERHTAVGDETKFASNTFNLGMRKVFGTTHSFNGNLDDIRIIDTATSTVVAEWLFEGNVGDASFLADTSGNGNDLVIDGTYTGITSSTDTMGGTGTSANFDGSALLSSISELDLSDYQTITIQYKIKDDTANSTGIFMELGPNVNNSKGGEFYMSSKEKGSGIAGLMISPGRSTSNANQDYMQLTSGTWYDMEITMDQTTQDFSDVVTVTQDSTPLTGTDRPDRNAVPAPVIDDFLYASDFFYLGGRNLNSKFYTGYIDEMKIETFEDSPNIPGDANHDNKVDGSDVTILADNWQAGVPGGASNVTWEMGDFNGDHMVDGSDVTILADNWQFGVTSASAPVPEPSTVLLLVSALASLAMLRRRR